MDYHRETLVPPWSGASEKELIIMTGNVGYWLTISPQVGKIKPFKVIKRPWVILNLAIGLS